MSRLRSHLVILTVLLLTLLLFVGCSGLSRPERLTVEVTTPASRGNVTEGEVLVSGVVSDAGATLTINDQTVNLTSDGAFDYTVPLGYGSNRISLRAEKEGFTAGTRTINLTRTLTLTMLSPETPLETRDSSVTVSGTVSDPTARVRIAGADAPVTEDGVFSISLPLHYIETLINVTAEVAEAAPVTETLTILRPEA